MAAQDIHSQITRSLDNENHPFALLSNGRSNSNMTSMAPSTTARLTHPSILSSLQMIIDLIATTVVHNNNVNSGHGRGVFDKNIFIRRYPHFRQPLRAMQVAAGTRALFIVANLLRTSNTDIQAIISSITSDVFLDVITAHREEQIKQSVEPISCKCK